MRLPLLPPEEEIERIKREYASDWSRLEPNSEIQKAIANNDPVKLAEVAAMIIYGNRVPVPKKLPKYAMNEAAMHLALRGEARTKRFAKIIGALKKYGIAHGDFQTADAEANERRLATAIQAYNIAKAKVGKSKFD
jgi:hypothetical protein